MIHDQYWTRFNKDIDADQIPYPVFVKPARSGSSYGVTKVSRKEELLSAVETARAYDSKVLIEEAVVGSEIGCAILGNDMDDLMTGELDRVSLSHGFFRIHQESNPESGSENATFIVPADITEESRACSRDSKGHLSRPRMQRTCAGGYVPDGRWKSSA